MIFSDSCRVCRRRIGEDGFCENEDCGMHWKQMYGQTFDALERKEKENAALRKAAEWQPPDTAPKGGEMFIVGDIDDRELHPCCFLASEKEFRVDYGRGFCGPELPSYFVWRPIPPLPKGGGG